MPRNGSSIFYNLPGTEGFPDTTIESEKYNNYIADIAFDLNLPRPIIAGGTGADDANDALSNLGGEKSSQLVANYDSYIFLPGSFYSLPGATGAPPEPTGQTATHPFVGWAVSSDVLATPPANQNVVVHARNQTDTKVPGTLYVREKKAGVWGPWAVDGGGIASPSPPLTPADGTLWWDSETGTLYVWYRDIDSAAWVIASPQPDPALFLQKSGDTMTGTLVLAGPPTNDMDAANKKYVDGKVAKTGDTMTGPLTITNLSAPATGTLTLGNANIFYSTSVFNFAGSIAATANVQVNGNLGVNGTTVLIGKATINDDLTVRRSYQPTTGVIFFGSSGQLFLWCPAGPGSFQFQNAGVIAMAECYKPGGGPWADTSDARTKNVLGEYTQGLSAIKQITPKRYTFKGNTIDGMDLKGVFPAQRPGGPNPRSRHFTVAERKEEFIGLIAQDVEGVMPEMVKKISTTLDGREASDVRSLDSNALTYALINAVKELAARIEALEGNKNVST